MAIASWEAVENALHAAVMAASALGPAVILWGEQGQTRPNMGPYIELVLEGPNPVAPVAMETSTNLARAAGLEVEKRALGYSECVLTIKVFGGQGGDSGAGAAAGNTAARSVASGIAINLNKASIRDALIAAGIGVANIGPVQRIGAIRRAGFEPRAMLDVRLYVSEAATELIGYFSKTTVENLTTGTLTAIPNS